MSTAPNAGVANSSNSYDFASGDIELSTEQITELDCAISALCESENIRFTPLASSSTMLSQRMLEFSDACDIPNYKMRLPPRWWKDNFGAMLCVADLHCVDGGEAASEGAPEKIVAVIRLPNGSYQAVGPDSARTLTADDCSQFSSWAWKVVRTFDNTHFDSTQEFVSPSVAPARKPQLTKRLIKFAWPAIRPNLRAVLVGIACSILLSFSAPIAFKQIIDVAIPVSDVTFLFSVLAALICINVSQACIVLARGLAMLKLQTNTTQSVQSAIWKHLLELPVSFFRNKASGDLVHRSMMFTQASQELGNVTIQAGMAAAVTCSSIFVATWLSPKLMLFALPLALAEATLLLLIVKRIRSLSIDMELRRAEVLGLLAGLMRGILKVRASAGERFAKEKTKTKHSVCVENEMAVQFLQDIRGLLGIVIPAASSLVVFAAGFKLISTPGQSLTLGGFAAFIASYRAFAHGLTGVGNLIAEVLQAQAHLAVVEPILNTKRESTRGRTAPGELTGHIRLCNVSFRYPGKANHVLDNVSLECQPGEMIGIMGATGSGKSSIIRLLLGFEKADSGEVEYDSMNVNSLDMHQIRKRVGCVLQSAAVAGGTIRENIAAGRHLSDEAIWRALELADLSDEIRSLELGLQTIVSQRGSNLSGGQRQRLILARALAGTPSILILDEALSGLDVSQQERILQRLHARNLTILIVSHRQDSLRHTSRIYSVDDGKIQCLSASDDRLASK